jgi:hypothetical protein
MDATTRAENALTVCNRGEPKVQLGWELNCHTGRRRSAFARASTRESYGRRRPLPSRAEVVLGAASYSAHSGPWFCFEESGKSREVRALSLLPVAALQTIDSDED